MFAAIVGQSWADDAHPFNLEINGVDWIGRVHYPSINIEMPGPGSNGSMTFVLEDWDATVTVNEWDEVRFIEHAATRPILFGGFVQSVRYVAWAANGRSVVVTCVGYGILLDRKVHVESALPFNVDVDEVVQRMVALYGGDITAQAATSFASPDATNGIPNFGSVTTGRWLIDYFTGASEPVVPASSYLRGAIEYILGIGLSEADFIADLSTIPVPGVYWVDSARMFRLLADGSGSSHTKWQSGGSDFNGQWDGGYPGFAFDTSGTYTIEHVEYERENTDLLTSAYVDGGAANGTGFYRAQGHERAGDLETVLVDENSLTAADIATKGAGAVAKTTNATARGQIVVSSSTPLAIWPGRHVTVNYSQVGVTSSQDWRATAVSIAFRSSTNRTYTVGFGGGITPARPSAMRRSGRFARRRI